MEGIGEQEVKEVQMRRQERYEDGKERRGKERGQEEPKEYGAIVKENERGWKDERGKERGE